MRSLKSYNRIIPIALSGFLCVSTMFQPVTTFAQEEQTEEAVAAETVDDNAFQSETEDENAETEALSTNEPSVNAKETEGNAQTVETSESENQGTKIPNTADSITEQPVSETVAEETDNNSNEEILPDTKSDSEDEAGQDGEQLAGLDDNKEEILSEEDQPNGSISDNNAASEVSYEANADGIIVHAKAKTGVLPEEAELHTSRIWDSSVSSTLDNHGADYDGYIAFNISFVKDGDAVEPDGEVSVTFDLQDVIPSDAKTVEVKHFDESGDSLDVVTVADTGDSSSGDVSVNGTSATAEFEVSSFSTFAIVWKNGNDSKGWPANTYLNINCKDQHGNLLTDDFVPKTVVLADKSSYKVLLNAGNKDLEIPAVGSGTAATIYTFTSAEAVIGGDTYNTTAIEASYLETTGWTYTVTYKNNELEKYISDLTSDQISLTLYYSNEDTSVSFSLNGGTGTTPEAIKGKGGTKITLPDPADYGVSRRNYTFIGWAEISDLKQDTDFHEVYKAGDEYYLPTSGSKMLYAAWTSTAYGNATFYIRLDAKVAPEPSQHESALYTTGESINNTVKEQRWIIDMDATERNGVHVQNNISNNMETLPTARQLKARINAKRSSIGFTVDVNDEGKLYVSNVSDPNNALGVTKGDILYVHWYVQKWATAGGSFWNVDGVLLTEKTIEVTYHGNPNGADISNLPAGYSINPGTDVTVGVSGAASADSSHSLLYTAKTGYELVGWNTKADGTGETYKVGDVFRPTKTTTLYAMWSKLPRGSVKITKQLTGDIAYGSSDAGYKIRLSINSAWVNGKESATKYDSVEDGTGTFISEGVFTGEWTDSEGVKWSSYEFSLKDGQSIVVSGLYDATIFKIDEIDTAGCELSYNGYDKTNAANNRIETGVTKSVILYNKMPDVVQTGIYTDTTPFATELVVLAIGCIAAVAIKKRRRLPP